MRWFCLVMLLFTMNGLWAYDMLEPPQLEKKIAACKPHLVGEDVCNSLRKQYDHFSRLAYELRVNPLQYGSKVLALQEKLNSSLTAANDKQQLQERMIVIKWLEAPER